MSGEHKTQALRTCHDLMKLLFGEHGAEMALLMDERPIPEGTGLSLLLSMCA